MDPEILHRLVEVAPTPIALLAQRAQNDCAVERQHHNAYFVFEFWLRMLSAVAAARWRRQEREDPSVDAALAALTHPSVGMYLSFLRAYAKASGDQSLVATWKTPLAANMERGYAWACSQSGVDPHPRPTLGEFAGVLVSYRNRHMGHGALHDSAFYRRGADALFGSIGSLVLTACSGLPGRFLCVEDIEDAPDGERLATLLELRRGMTTRLIDRIPVATLGDNVERAQVFYESGAERLCVFPWLLWHERSLLVLNRATETRADYLDYLTGNEVVRPRAVASIKAALRTQQLSTQKPSDEARTGRWIANYEIVGALGHGGNGTVYRARQASLGMPVALKVIPRATYEDPVAKARFEREVDILKRCEHPNIVTVLDVGEAGGEAFYAMEVVSGCSFAEVYTALAPLPTERRSKLRAGHLERITSSFGDRKSLAPPGERVSFVPEALPSWDERAVVTEELLDEVKGEGEEMWKVLLLRFAEVADALQYLHDRGVIHRDIKPGNIMLANDGKRAVVMDLGIARTTDCSRHTSQKGFVGTLRYASREQALHSIDDLDFRADLYSLGATMYELFTLSPLYAGDERTAGTLTETALLRKILDERPEPPLRRNPDLSPEVGIVLEKLLEKQPERRFYGSAAELAKDLRAIYDQRPIAAREYTAAERRAYDLYDLLRGQASTWNAGHRDEDLLWGEERVAELTALAVAEHFDLSPTEREFYVASIDHARRQREVREVREASDARRVALEAESLRTRRRLRRSALVVGFVLPVAFSIGVTVALERLRMEQAAAYVVRGQQAEREGRWDEAELYYASALAVARGRIARRLGVQTPPTGRARASDARPLCLCSRRSGGL